MSAWARHRCRCRCRCRRRCRCRSMGRKFDLIVSGGRQHPMYRSSCALGMDEAWSSGGLVLMGLGLGLVVAAAAIATHFFAIAWTQVWIVHIIIPL